MSKIIQELEIVLIIGEYWKPRKCLSFGKHDKKKSSRMIFSDQFIIFHIIFHIYRDRCTYTLGILDDGEAAQTQACPLR